MKLYTKCRISGILNYFIIKDVKPQSPPPQKHPSVNTSILLLFTKTHWQLLSFIHFTAVPFINVQIHWLAISPWLQWKRNKKSPTKSLHYSAVWGCPSPKPPRISLSSALGSWFQDKARGSLIFKSGNLDQRRHLYSKITGFAAGIDKEESVQTQAGWSGSHLHLCPGGCETLQLCQGAISRGKQQRPSPG